MRKTSQGIAPQSLNNMLLIGVILFLLGITGLCAFIVCDQGKPVVIYYKGSYLAAISYRAVATDYLRYSRGELDEDIDRAQTFETFEEAKAAAEQVWIKRQNDKARIVTEPVTVDESKKYTLVYGRSGDLLGLRLPSGGYFDKHDLSRLDR